MRKSEIRLKLENLLPCVLVFDNGFIGLTKRCTAGEFTSIFE